MISLYVYVCTIYMWVLCVHVCEYRYVHGVLAYVQGGIRTISTTMTSNSTHQGQKTKSRV